MKKSMNKIAAWLLVLLLPMILLSCSSGGSSSGDTTPAPQGTATSLQVADKVSVVDAKLSGSVAAVAPLHIGLFKVSAADLAAASDYKADKTQVWVSERSAEAFNEINNILCMIAQSKGDAMLNKGAYVALVDESQCDTSRSDASSAGQDSQNQSSSASSMPDYTTFTVIATRADNNSPQYAKVWVHLKQKGSDPEQVVLVNLTITEGKSDTNPYGLFTMTFLGHPSTDGVMDTSQVSFKGVMKSEVNAAGEVLLRFAEQNFGPYTSVRKIALNRLADGSGKGSVYDQHPEMDTTVTSQFDIAFNTDYFLRNDGTNSICLDRNQFEESAWRYGLYDTAGQRLNRNSGFSVNTMADGSGKYGFIGYWGLWIDNNVTLNNDDFLYKFDYSNTGAAPLQYTVVKSGGKLKKHTKKTMTLAEIKGIPLNYSECGQGCVNYQVVWDGTNFNKIAQMPQCTGNTSCNWENLTTPIPIDTNTLQWGELNFYSQSLGGQVRVPLTNCVQSFPACSFPNPCPPPTTTCTAPDNATNIIFFAEDIVYPTDTVPSSFACFDNCPQVDANGEAYTTMMSSGPSNTAMIYTFNPSTMLLMTTGTSTVPVVMSVATSTNQWGVMSGALIDTNTPNLSTLLACDWNASQICGYKAWSALDVFYTWETGPGSWNQFSALKDGTGAMLKFEPPLSVKYVHNKAPYVGATFMMEYSGFGNLNGIPGKCVDMDSGLNADCVGNDPKIRYVPAFVIPPAQTDGSLTKVMVDTTEYLVKPLELEQRMLKVPAGNCSALSVTSYTLPDLATEWTDPAIGTEPVVTAAPAVIGGVVQ